MLLLFIIKIKGNIITICIPINLEHRQEIVAALANRYGKEYVLMERVFQSTITQESCFIEICDRRRRGTANREAICEADHFDPLTLKQISHCPQVIYLTSTDIGFAACLRMTKLTQVMLQIGGVAVKLESTGVAYDQDRWLACSNVDDVFEIYSLFVTLIEGEDYYYSCGMHNFGKADVAIALTEDLGLAIYVMNVFNYYRLTESPILQDGHTFQPDITCSQYQIKWMMDQENDQDSYQHNPHGRWYLQKLASSF
ncbi:MAG: hypothetical protein RLZZ04_2131 [Cyanobacteriota bacterium]